jgi:hypothetical protein
MLNASNEPYISFYQEKFGASDIGTRTIMYPRLRSFGSGSTFVILSSPYFLLLCDTARLSVSAEYISLILEMIKRLPTSPSSYEQSAIERDRSRQAWLATRFSFLAAQDRLEFASCANSFTGTTTLLSMRATPLKSQLT